MCIPVYIIYILPPQKKVIFMMIFVCHKIINIFLPFFLRLVTKMIKKRYNKNKNVNINMYVETLFFFTVFHSPFFPSNHFYSVLVNVTVKLGVNVVFTGIGLILVGDIVVKIITTVIEMKTIIKNMIKMTAQQR